MSDKDHASLPDETQSDIVAVPAPHREARTNRVAAGRGQGARRFGLVDPAGKVPISAISPPDSGMIAPLPNCFSMAAMALATAFSFSFMLDMVRSFCQVRSLVGRERGTGGLRRGGRS